MIRVLDTPQGVGGGAVRLAAAQKYPRTIIITASHKDSTANHAAFFARSRRELNQRPVFGQSGIAIVVPTTTAAATTPSAPVTDTAAGGGAGTTLPISYVTFVFEGYAGELWAAADVTNTVQVDVFDSAATES
jgi:hypothetical protein